MRLGLAALIAALLSSPAASSYAADDPDAPLEASDTEFTAVPVVGGDSDVGIGVGYVLSLARTERGVKPYVWRLESGGAITGKFGDGPVELGYLDDYLTFVVPHAFVPSLYLEARLGYTDEPGLKYYGLGNASRAAPDPPGSEEFFEYQRRRPIAAIMARYKLWFPLILTWGIKYTHNELSYPSDGRLAQDLQTGSPKVRELLRLTPSQDVFQFSVGAGWDTRDDETATHRGQYHTFRLDYAPGGIAQIPFTWTRANVALRFYLPIVGRRLMFAARGVADLLIGEAPFVELSRFDETEAIGGGRGVRGVPAQRYYGKVKLFSNLELRTELFDFELFDKNNVVGVTGFFDSGRVFADYEKLPELDGTALGLKYGVGGGLRLAAGTSFVLRADLAWSPDANPVGAYLLAGHIF